MIYDAAADTSSTKRDEFIDWLTAQTVADLKSARGDAATLETAIKTYIQRATTANLTEDDIEDILGVNEPSIMDLAELSEANEELVVDVFEEYLDRE